MWVKYTKTGFTSKAGFCLTSTAKRNNVRLISVIMNAPSSSERNAMTKTLLDYGFSNMKANILFLKGNKVGCSKIDKAKLEDAQLYAIEDIILSYQGQFDESKLKKQIIFDKKLVAPLYKGDIIAYLKVIYDGEEYYYPLTIDEDILAIDDKDLFWDYFKESLV